MGDVVLPNGLADRGRHVLLHVMRWNAAALYGRSDVTSRRTCGTVDHFSLFERLLTPLSSTRAAAAIS
jgi:hypothetical protein